MADSVVYFAESQWEGMGSVFKIGFSTNLERRADALRVGHPSLRIVASAPGDYGVEQVVHSLFQKERFQGEWFKSSPGIVNLAAYCREVGKFPQSFWDAAEAERFRRYVNALAAIANSKAAGAIRGIRSPRLRAVKVVESVTQCVRRADRYGGSLEHHSIVAQYERNHHKALSDWRKGE